MINLGAMPGVKAVPATGSTPQDIPVRIDFVAEDSQFGGRRGWRDGERIVNFKSEACRLADLIEGDAGMQAEDLHPSGARVEAENGQVGDDTIGAGSGG